MQYHPPVNMMLIVEDEDNNYEPIGLASSRSEALELAKADFRSRLRDLETGGSPLCPYLYKLWRQGPDGTYRVDWSTTPLEL